MSHHVACPRRVRFQWPPAAGPEAPTASPLWYRPDAPHAAVAFQGLHTMLEPVVAARQPPPLPPPPPAVVGGARVLSPASGVDGPPPAVVGGARVLSPASGVDGPPAPAEARAAREPSPLPHLRRRRAELTVESAAATRCADGSDASIRARLEEVAELEREVAARCLENHPPAAVPSLSELSARQQRRASEAAAAVRAGSPLSSLGLRPFEAGRRPAPASHVQAGRPRGRSLEAPSTTAGWRGDEGDSDGKDGPSQKSAAQWGPQPEERGVRAADVGSENANVVSRAFSDYSVGFTEFTAEHSAQECTKSEFAAFSAEETRNNMQHCETAEGEASAYVQTKTCDQFSHETISSSDRRVTCDPQTHMASQPQMTSQGRHHTTPASSVSPEPAVHELDGLAYSAPQADRSLPPPAPGEAELPPIRGEMEPPPARGEISAPPVLDEVDPPVVWGHMDPDLAGSRSRDQTGETKETTEAMEETLHRRAKCETGRDEILTSQRPAEEGGTTFAWPPQPTEVDSAPAPFAGGHVEVSRPAPAPAPAPAPKPAPPPVLPKPAPPASFAPPPAPAPPKQVSFGQPSFAPAVAPKPAPPAPSNGGPTKLGFNGGLPGLGGLGGGPGGGPGGGRGSMAGRTNAPRRGRGQLNPAATGSRIPHCATCANQIRGPFITALGQCWCPGCFVCATPQCRQSLENIGFVEVEGQTHCENCWERHLAPVCNKCQRRIKEDCLKAIGKAYHPECFACAYCGGLFGNSAFFLEDGLPYCENDWNELFTTKCVGCGFPIEAGDRWVEALNKNFHSQCFKCAICGNNLEGQSFFAKQGRPFCKHHARM